jgi:hypothetical protein
MLQLLAAGLGAVPAAAAETACVNPRHAGIKAEAQTWPPGGDEAVLARDLHAFAVRNGLHVGGGAIGDPGRDTLWFRHIGLQSPRYSVVLTATLDSRSRAVGLSVERTCINEARPEPWAPYWRGLLSYLRARDYVVRPVGAGRRR